MRSQPVILAMIVANLAMLAFLFFALKGAAEFRDSMLKLNAEYQREVNQLLARCVVPEKT
jgi:hypothetical protein